jgi:O-antigen ligase
MLITKNDKVRGITRRVIAISVVILSIMILFNYTSSGTIGIKRGVSVFDFSKDEGNVARLKSWYLALKKIEESAPFGLGFGATGTIGRKKAPIGGIANVYSTESRYLQVFLEGGVFVGIAFLILVVWTAYKGLKIRSRVNVLSYAIFIAISAESIMGGALEAPLTSLVYWISFAQIYQSIEKKNEYLKEDLIKVEIPMPRVG